MAATAAGDITSSVNKGRWASLGKFSPHKGTHLIKVADDFVQKSETLQPLLVHVVLVVELCVVRDGGEHDGDVLVTLGVQLLKRRRQCSALNNKAIHTFRLPWSTFDDWCKT